MFHLDHLEEEQLFFGLFSLLDSTHPGRLTIGTPRLTVTGAAVGIDREGAITYLGISKDLIGLNGYWSYFNIRNILH